MWFTVPGILLLFLHVNPTVSKDICSNVALKEAILSLARIIKDNGQKLERHETRERQLGEYMKKAVGDLSIKVSGVETFGKQFTKIEDQISQIEQLISQRDERERIQMQRTADMIERLENHLEAGLNGIRNTIAEVKNRVEPTEPSIAAKFASTLDIVSRINDTEAQFLEKMSEIHSHLDEMAHKNEEKAAKEAEKLWIVLNQTVEKGKSQVQDTAKLINDFENRLGARLNEIDTKIQKVDAQNDEQGQIQTQETVRLIQNLENRLEIGLNEINSTIHEIDEQSDEKDKIQSQEAARLIQNLENRLELRLNDINATIHKVDKQSDEKDENQSQETGELIKNLGNRLETQLKEINDTIHGVNEYIEAARSNATTESVQVSDVMSKLNDNEANFLQKVAQIESKLNVMINKNEDDVDRQSENLKKIYNEVQNITGRIEEIESSLEKAYENAKIEAEKPVEKPIDVAPMIEEQIKGLEKVTELLENTLHRTEQLPTKSDITTLHMNTESALQEATSILEEEIENKMNRLISNVSENNGEIKDTVGALRLDLANNAEQVNTQLGDIAKSQGVMVSMADHVFDTRKALEFGVHRILSEIGNLINSTSTEITAIMNTRFDDVSNNIVNNNSRSIANLTNKFEQKLEEIWRQLSIMELHITESASTLDKLKGQNEAYFNGTISTMNGVESKVGDMNAQINKVNEDLNFTMLRLSSINQEFNRIKSGLGAALDEIKASFKEVQTAANDLNKLGRHPLPSGHEEPESNLNYPETVSRPNETHQLGDIIAN